MYDLKALFNPKNVCVWKRHLYTGNLNSESPGDSKNAFLHWGDGLDVLEVRQRHEYQTNVTRLAPCKSWNWNQARQQGSIISTRQRLACSRYVNEVTRLTSTVGMTSWHLLLTNANPVSMYCSNRPFRKARSASARLIACSGVDRLPASLPSQLLRSACSCQASKQVWQEAAIYFSFDICATAGYQYIAVCTWFVACQALWDFQLLSGT